MRILALALMLFSPWLGCASTSDQKPDASAIVEASVIAWEFGCTAALPEIVAASCEAGPAAKPIWQAAQTAAATAVAFFGDESLIVADAANFIDTLTSRAVPSWLAATIKSVSGTVLTALPFDETTKRVDPYARDSIRRMFAAVEAGIARGLEGCSVVAP